MHLWWWTGRIFALAVIGVVGGCSGEKLATGAFPETCAELESFGGRQHVDFVPSADELAAMGDDEKRMSSEAMEDYSRFQPLLMRICELSRENALPGVGSIPQAGRGEFWVARARREEWIDVAKGIAPATAERRCDRLWFMVLESEGRNEFRYFFCDTVDGFALISGYEKQGDSWMELE